MLRGVRHIKKGDNVVALSGVYKSKFGKVLEVDQKRSRVKVDGMGLVKKHQKPTQQDQKGGIIEKNRWMPACVFQACDASGKGKGRVSFKISKDGEKQRVFSKAGAAKKTPAKKK